MNRLLTIFCLDMYSPLLFLLTCECEVININIENHVMSACSDVFSVLSGVDKEHGSSSRVHARACFHLIQAPFHYFHIAI